MEEFVDGYMKIHATSNGKRRWSRKSSMFQTISEDDLEKLRMKMDSAMLKTPNDKKTEEKIETKEAKDNKTPATRNDNKKTTTVVEKQ